MVRPVGDGLVEVVREFDAPRHLVFRAFTEPEPIKRWWAGRRARVRSGIQMWSEAAAQSETGDVQAILPMELGGFEPPTSWVRSRRSAN